MKNKIVYSHLRSIFESAVKRVDPYAIIRDHLSIRDEKLHIKMESYKKSFDLADYDSLIVLGAGKATAKMAVAVEEIFGGRIKKGLISVKKGHTENLRYIETITAGHPVPDKMSVEAGRRIAALSAEADKRTLFINLISGGGSALLSYPLATEAAGVTLEDKQRVTNMLLACGATIQEINSIRKHISAIKGGRLARLIYPATSINLILSDVVGDRLDTIASGLTTGDQTSYEDALGIIEKYSLTGELPASVGQILALGAKGDIEDTPAPDDPLFEKVHNVLIGTNFSALAAARQRAEELGYNTMILSSRITGEAREVAKFFLGIGRDINKYGVLLQKPACIIAGGETTVTLQGNGLGGRNQEMALSFLYELANDAADAEGIYFLSAGTDGNDGPTDAAGAFAALDIVPEGGSVVSDITSSLKDNDSYNYFDRINQLLKTGPTNTNVGDVQIMIVC
ncbi:MAG TPA: glycerate kinase [Spirochaetales bacterium]|nr:glycerate kinase [Spirochaetales bacterium]